MNVQILRSSDHNLVRNYVQKKFTGFRSWTYSKKTRRLKCRQYYDAASENNRGIIEDIYGLTFDDEEFPGPIAEKSSDSFEMMNSLEWLDEQRDKAARAQSLVLTLEGFKQDREYETGEAFLQRLMQMTSEFNPELVSPKEFKTESEARLVQELTHKVQKSPKEISAEFEGMIGIRQNAKISFEGYSPNWGEVSAKLEQEFKAGLWGRASASARMTRLGFSSELQAAIAMGGEFNINGDCTWRKGKAGLNLAGNCNMFFGAKGSLSASLSASAFKGLEASFEAGAFAGVSFEASGECGLTYAGEDLIRTRATASIMFGAGANFSASLKVPIFGATEISASGSLTLGIGSGTSVETSINFSQIYLAGTSEFRRLVYLPTILRGYKMTLMTQDAKNLHYLNKCISRIGDEGDEAEENVTSFLKLKSEKQPLVKRAFR